MQKVDNCQKFNDSEAKEKIYWIQVGDGDLIQVWMKSRIDLIQVAEYDLNGET